MHWTNRDRTIALAGIFQAIALVQQLAKTGRMDQKYLEQSLSSLFQIESENTETIFGGLSNLKLGLQTTRNQMGGLTKTRNIEFTRYIISIIHLEQQLAKSESMLEKMKLGLERLKDTISQHGQNTPQALIQSIKEQINQFVGTQAQYDDITLVVMEVE